jgi:hypothetical protein
MYSADLLLCVHRSLLDFNLLTGSVSAAFGEFSNSGAVGVREEPEDYEYW